MLGRPCRLVDELIDDDDVAGSKLFPQAADRADGQQELDAEPLQRVHVGAKVDLARRDAVTAAVPRHKRHADAAESSDHQRIGGLAEWRPHANLAGSFQSGIW